MVFVQFDMYTSMKILSLSWSKTNSVKNKKNWSDRTKQNISCKYTQFIDKMQMKIYSPPPNNHKRKKKENMHTVGWDYTVIEKKTYCDFHGQFWSLCRKSTWVPDGWIKAVRFKQMFMLIFYSHLRIKSDLICSTYIHSCFVN